jgi:transposase
MNTNDIAAEYRLSHWAGIMRKREESGLSIKQFCKDAGFHENRYYYWQKKLREAACGELAKVRGGATGLIPAGFAEVKLSALQTPPPPAATFESQVCVEAAGVRIIAGGEYPADKLAVLIREVRPC